MNFVVEYHLRTQTGVTHHKYTTPSPLAASQFFERIKHDARCFFADLIKPVGSTVQIKCESYGIPLPCSVARDFVAKVEKHDIEVKKRKKTLLKIEDLCSEVRVKYWHSDGFLVDDVMYEFGLGRNKSRAVVQALLNANELDFTNKRAGKLYKFIKGNHGKK